MKIDLRLVDAWKKRTKHIPQMLVKIGDESHGIQIRTEITN